MSRTCNLVQSNSESREHTVPVALPSQAIATYNPFSKGAWFHLKPTWALPCLFWGVHLPHGWLSLLFLSCACSRSHSSALTHRRPVWEGGTPKRNVKLDAKSLATKDLGGWSAADWSLEACLRSVGWEFVTCSPGGAPGSGMEAWEAVGFSHKDQPIWHLGAPSRVAVA